MRLKENPDISTMSTEREMSVKQEWLEVEVEENLHQEEQQKEEQEDNFSSLFF